MARYNRKSYSRRHRRPQNTIWQSMNHSSILTIPAGAEGSVVSGVLEHNQPGTGVGDDFRAFDDQHVLERIRGTMCHNAGGQESTTVTDWFSFSLGGIKVPTGMSADELNLFDNLDADDYFFRMDAVCNAGTRDAMPNWHEVDSKSKRRFEVGDKIAWLWSLIRPGMDTRSMTIDLAFNFRVLWKLRN